MTYWSDKNKRSQGTRVRKEEKIYDKNGLIHALNSKDEKGDKDRLSSIMKSIDPKSKQSISEELMKVQDENSLLSLDEVFLLQVFSELHFELGEFKSLADMLNKLAVRVVICAGTPRRSVPTGLLESKLFWKNEEQRLKELGEDNPLYREADKELDEIKDEVENWRNMRLYGRYDRFEKKIYLFPEAMLDVDKEECLGSTFVHEAMHAYFDRHPHELFPYWATVEEPLAEFGMLLFLRETTIVGEAGDGYFEWALNNVKSKKNCYSYGAVLMDSYENGNDQIRSQIRRDLESYKRKIF